MNKVFVPELLCQFGTSVKLSLLLAQYYKACKASEILAEEKLFFSKLSTVF